MAEKTGLPVLFLMGPTASGKTGLAMQMVARWPLDIVSVDSAMVYRGMDIGTAKPTAAEQQQAPHRLIDILEPSQAYSAARFAEDARREIALIHQQGRIPLLVGGTMLYYRALQQGLSSLPEADAAIRQQISAAAQAEGWPALHARLAAVDPQTARRIHPNDAQRIQRALEVVEVSGQGQSAWHARGRMDSAPWPVIKMALSGGPRSDLRQRIADRFEAMLAAGFVEEVAGLYRRSDVQADSPAMRAVGYRQLWRHVSGEWPLATAVEKGITASRQLAKRQMTWLRRENDLHWLEQKTASLVDTVHDLLKAQKITFSDARLC